MPEITQLLESIDQGDPQAAEELLPLVYDQLRRLARLRMAKLPPGQTLQPTALVHEAWLRVHGSDAPIKPWSNRWHFFAAAAEAMRRILVDQARRKARVKHGGDRQRLDIDDFPLAAATDDDKILEIHDALTQLEAENETIAAVVKLKFFAGLTSSEIGNVMNVSEKTVQRHWSFAKTWLYQTIQADAVGK